MKNTSSFLTSLSDTQKIPTYVLGAWILYLVLSPFYIFPKGRPQPADFILLLGMLPVMASLFLSRRKHKEEKKKINIVYLLGGAFAVLTIVINLTNYAFYPHIRFLLASLIYPYDFAVFLFTAWMFQRNPEQAVKYSFYAVATSILVQIQVVFFFDFGFRGYRGTAGFENPNQLAYWALLTSAMVIFLRYGKKLRAIEWILLAALAFLQSLALSKAGIIAFVILIVFLFCTPKVSKSAYLIAAILVVVSLFYAFSKPDIFNKMVYAFEPVQNVIERIESIGSEPDDNPEARGYYRIIQYPLYTIFGAGEGSFDRFAMKGYDRELHSGIGTIIFSYGLTGALLFGTFLSLIILRQPWYYILLFAPIILFGLPHQNFRFAHFWVFLGMNYGLFLHYYKQKYIEKMKQLNSDQ